MGFLNRHRHLKPELLSEYLDGRLDQPHQGLVARRLADCPDCREELNTLRATVLALQSLPDLPLPHSFTLPAAPSPDYSSNLIRKPEPLIMRMPGWAYGSAASLAGLALAVMLSVEAVGLGSPAIYQNAGQAAVAPVAAPVAPEAQQETQQNAQTESLVSAPELASQAAAPPESPSEPRAAPPSLTNLRAKPAPTPDATNQMGEMAQAEKSLAVTAAPAPEAALDESQADAASRAGPAGGEAADFSGAPSDAQAPGYDAASVQNDTAPSAPAGDLPVAPEDLAQPSATETKIPDETYNFAAEGDSAPFSSTWWRASETIFAVLTLVFLAGLFLRLRRNRSQSDA